MKNIKKDKFVLPIIICVIGIIVLAVCGPLTEYVNAGVWIGLIILMIGTLVFASILYKEIYRIGIEMPFPLDKIFPNYPIVQDRNEIESRLSGFRQSLNDFLCDKRNVPNSSLQEYASQVLWHSMYLWKNRMSKKGITLSLESNRRAYTSKKNAVRMEEYFDGRYNVKDVYEEIDSTRTFRHNGYRVKELQDREVAHYTLLSAKEVGDGKYICPNCGATTTRNNLLDGCDYCGTKFTVEEMNNSVAAFGFRHDFQVNDSKREAIVELIYPWVFIITEMPFVYFGFFLAFIYLDASILVKFLTGIAAGILLGLVGYFFVKINMLIAAPIVMSFNAFKRKANRKIIYRSKEADENEKKMADYVRRYDSKFSIQSFFGGVQNKLLAVHFADREEEINAFSDADLSKHLEAYKNVIDVDIVSVNLGAYDLSEGNISNPDGYHSAIVNAELLLRDYVNGHITEKTEHIKMGLMKNGRCRTQAVCAPSLMKCEKCGTSRLLIDGKKCAYCGNILDMKKYDWVITDYSASPRLS